MIVGCGEEARGLNRRYFVWSRLGRERTCSGSAEFLPWDSFVTPMAPSPSFFPTPALVRLGNHPHIIPKNLPAIYCSGALGPCIRWYRSWDRRGALHAAARHAQGQIPSHDIFAISSIYTGYWSAA